MVNMTAALVRRGLADEEVQGEEERETWRRVSVLRPDPGEHVFENASMWLNWL